MVADVRYPNAKKIRLGRIISTPIAWRLCTYGQINQTWQDGQPESRLM